MNITLHLYLDKLDGLQLLVSCILLTSFELAVRSRMAAADPQRAAKLMILSCILLGAGHGLFMAVSILLSLDGFYVLNVGFILLALSGLRRVYKANKKENC